MNDMPELNNSEDFPLEEIEYDGVGPEPKRSRKPITTTQWASYLSEVGHNSFRLNEVTGYVEVDGQPLSDGLRMKIRSQIRDLGYAAVGQMEEAYQAISYDGRYNPVALYLHRVGDSWDGHDYIHDLSAYVDDKYDWLPDGRSVFEVFFKRWAIGAIGKVLFQQQNAALIFEGPQGIGKSHFAEWLCSGVPEYFLDRAITDAKDDKLAMSSNFIWHVSEISGTTRRADREMLKTFLTLKTVKVRPPYGRVEVTRPALASFIGSFNDEGNGYLSDPTGNRRFITVGINSIDFGYSTALNPDNVWAQAVALYMAGERGYLTPEETALRNEKNEEYESVSPVQNALEEMFAFDDSMMEVFTTTLDIVTKMDEKLKGNSEGHSRGISAAMTKLGRKGNRAYINGIRTRGYYGVISRDSSVITSHDTTSGKWANNYDVILSQRSAKATEPVKPVVQAELEDDDVEF